MTVMYQRPSSMDQSLGRWPRMTREGLSDESSQLSDGNPKWHAVKGKPIRAWERGRQDVYCDRSLPVVTFITSGSSSSRCSRCLMRGHVCRGLGRVVSLAGEGRVGGERQDGCCDGSRSGEYRRFDEELVDPMNNRVCDWKEIEDGDERTENPGKFDCLSGGEVVKRKVGGNEWKSTRGRRRRRSRRRREELEFVCLPRLGFTPA